MSITELTFVSLIKGNIIYYFTQVIFTSAFYLLDSGHRNKAYQIRV